MEEMQNILTLGSCQKVLHNQVLSAVLPKFEALMQRVRARGDERGGLSTIADKPANPGTKEECIEQQLQEAATGISGVENVGYINP